MTEYDIWVVPFSSRIANHFRNRNSLYLSIQIEWNWKAISYLESESADFCFELFMYSFSWFLF